MGEGSGIKYRRGSMQRKSLLSDSSIIVRRGTDLKVTGVFITAVILAARLAIKSCDGCRQPLPRQTCHKSAMEMGILLISTLSIALDVDGAYSNLPRT